MKVSIGQGDQGGSVYKGAAAVLGTGHGQDHNGVAKGYYTSLDGGGDRNERLRYDSPAVGPVSAGISISGAWGKGSNYTGATDPGDPMVAAGSITAAKPAMAGALVINIDIDEALEGVDVQGDGTAETTLQAKLAALKAQIDNGNMEGTSTGSTPIDVNEVKRMYNVALMAHACYDAREADTTPESWMRTDDGGMAQDCGTDVRRTYAVDAVDGDPAMDIPAGADTVHLTDPSLFQVAVSYAFGDTSVGVSWYQSNDMQCDGSELTAIGVGVDHNLPKLGTKRSPSRTGGSRWPRSAPFPARADPPARAPVQSPCARPLEVPPFLLRPPRRAAFVRSSPSIPATVSGTTGRLSGVRACSSRCPGSSNGISARRA